MTFNINLADITFQLIVHDYSLFKEFKENYKVTGAKKPISFSIDIIMGDFKKLVHFKALSYSKGVLYFDKKKRFFSFQTLNFFIKCFIQFFSLRHNIYVLHASSFMIDDNGYVFMGKAGAGKSTILSFTEKNKRFADDTSIIKKVNKDYYLYPSPFDKKKCPNTKLKKSKLKAVFSIKKSPNTTIVEFKNKEKSCKELLSNVFFYQLLMQLRNTKYPFLINFENRFLNRIKVLNNNLFIVQLLFQKNSLFIKKIKDFFFL